MPELWWKAQPQDLYRLEDRVSSLYVERCHIDRADNAIVLVNRERKVHVPAAFLAVVLIGPGARITSAASALLADSGTAVCWVGERGVRMYAAGIGPSRGSQLVLRQAWLVTRPKERLAVARRMYAKRFPGEDVSALSMQQLRGREGSRIKRIYREHSERTGVPWNRRVYKHGDPHGAGDDINRLLSAAHSALYGISHAVIAGVGASPALGFVHTGASISFVLDIADLYKADYTIPIAFDLAAEGRFEEREARLAVRDRIAEGRLMPQMISDIKDLLLPENEEFIDRDLSALWDGEDDIVESGVNWSGDIFDENRFLSVTGPETASSPMGSP